jgi:hypothetical protein
VLTRWSPERLSSISIAEIVDALAKFDQAVPNLHGIRNPLTHPSDDTRLDGVAWFDSVVKLLPNEAVEYLVDPRHQHHDAALELSRAMEYRQIDLQSPTAALADIP